jgi:predicted transcriptional regulator of viral defense system
MPKQTTKQEQVLDLARKAKILRVQDLSEKGIHPEHLRRLYQRGLLVRMGRGVYMLPNTSISANFSLAEVAKKVPRGIIFYSRHFVSTKLGRRVLSKSGSRLTEKPLARVLIRPDFG